jgi:hypothetical protein
MLSKRGGRGRRRLVACVAVFIALGGTAYAARPLITGAKARSPALVGPRLIAWRESTRA